MKTYRERKKDLQMVLASRNSLSMDAWEERNSYQIYNFIKHMYKRAVTSEGSI